MRFLLNILWIIFGGFLAFIGWAFFGLLWCITIVGIPVGVQCFKAARLTLAPFGKRVVIGQGGASFIVNILWWIFGGIELFLLQGAIGIVLCITIIGIPWGKQFFKFALLALFPFGSKIRRA